MHTGRAKRQRKLLHNRKHPVLFPLDSLSALLNETPFEEVIEPLIDDFSSARKKYEETLAEVDELVRIYTLKENGTAKVDVSSPRDIESDLFDFMRPFLHRFN